MKTFHRICIEDLEIVADDGSGREFKIERGKEYLTSEVDSNGDVVVFSGFWIWGIPVNIFAGEKEFTK